jgi:diguanylate cyclase (GGDEF)-like protein
MTRFLFLFLFSTFSSLAQSEAVFSDIHEQLELTSYTRFTVTDTPTLTGNEQWVSKASRLPRKPEQYLHFKVTVASPHSTPTPVWFNITFPAIKHLYVSDGTNQWLTGDALAFSTREVDVPNYHFPTILPAKGKVTFYGHMQGEILRYSFSVATPEKITNSYISILQRDMAFFGAMTMLTALCFVVYFATRKRAFLSFAIFILATTFWFFRVFGYAFKLFWPNLPILNDISYAISIYAVLLSAFWVLFATLKRPGRVVYGYKFVRLLCFALPFLGVGVWKIAGLNLALRLPVILFVPFLIISIIVIFKEHKRGSGTAKWLAIAMLPVSISTLVLVMIALSDNLYAFDPIAMFMIGLLLTCTFMIVLTSNYLVRVLQSERDKEKAIAELQSKQTAMLEALVKDRTKELETSNKMLTELASKDALTNLPNRRSIDLFVDESFDTPLYANNALAIALIDLDHFKSINDTFGHDVGDIVLRKIANILRPLNNAETIAGRFGGEEFAIIWRNTAAEDTKESVFYSVLSNVHHNINTLVVSELKGKRLGACIGWTLCRGPDDIVGAFRRADKALYKAKDEGRNLIIHAP